jgi:pyruvate dehydrogenase E2 component (dihydrolipoamide acetyltransferase)
MPIEITMPALSPTMTEGNLAKWLKKEGDEVSSGDVIAEIETDKATMEVEAVDEGTIGKIVVNEGAQGVAVNSVIALLLEDGEDKSTLKDYKIKQPEAEQDNEKEESSSGSDEKEAKSQSPSAPVPSAQKTQAPAPQKTSAPSQVISISASSADVKASPVAKRLAENNGIDISQIKGTGPDGRIVKEDVEGFLKYGGPSAGIIRRDEIEFTRHENSNIRQIIARRLLEAKQQIPHFYLNIDCEVDDLLNTRRQINDLAPKDENNRPLYKVSVNDLVIKASALALKDVPEANASWYDDAIVQYNNVDISVAVATEGGLITPIIFNADQKKVTQISAEMKELAKRARANQLKPEEFQGGGFSISNLGMYGVKHFNAIINPPQSCILAVGTSEERTIVKEGHIEIANVMTVTLSVDHRSVDGAVGATYLQAFKKYIENPAGLLL